MRGAGRSARSRHRAPRSQAGQPLRHPEGGRHLRRQGARLRHLEDACGKRRCRRDAEDRGGGLAVVHVARAAHVARGRRRARRHLGARDHALRNADGRDSISCRRDTAHLRQDPARSARAPLRAAESRRSSPSAWRRSARSATRAWASWLSRSRLSVPSGRGPRPIEFGERPRRRRRRAGPRTRGSRRLRRARTQVTPPGSFGISLRRAWLQNDGGDRS
jgi:hypothetical protein